MPLKVQCFEPFWDSGICFDLGTTKQQDRLFIVAQTGAGATTLLKICSGLQNPQQQVVHVVEDVRFFRKDAKHTDHDASHRKRTYL